MHKAALTAHISIHDFGNTFMVQVVAPWALKPGENKGIKATKSIRMTQAYFYSLTFKTKACNFKGQSKRAGF